MRSCGPLTLFLNNVHCSLQYVVCSDWTTGPEETDHNCARGSLREAIIVCDETSHQCLVKRYGGKMSNKSWKAGV